MKKNRDKRVKDFESRAAFSPESVYEHRARGWRYIPVHSLQDKKPEEPAIWVDCWCVLGADAALLECWTTEHSNRQPGLYVFIDKQSPNWWKLYAIFPSSTLLTRAAIEEVMERFVDLGFPDNFPFELKPGGEVIRLSEK